MKVAITGANGFLGSHLVQKCLLEGMQTHAIVRKGANCKSIKLDNPLLSIHPIDYSVALTDQLKELYSEIGDIDFVIHNAGLTVSLQKDEYFDVNTTLTGKLLNSIKESSILNKTGKFIYISSYAAHGPNGINHPVSFYGESKKQAEELVKSSGITHLIFRPTAVYGAGDYAFLPLFKAAKSGIYPVTGFNQKMTMIHGSDLAKTIVGEMPKSVGTIYVNDGNTYLHQDFMNALEEVLNRKIRKILIPRLLSKASLGLADIWYKIVNKRPSITLEKFEEITQDWNLHETELPHSNIPANFSLKSGFEDALAFYQENKLL